MGIKCYGSIPVFQTGSAGSTPAIPTVITYSGGDTMNGGIIWTVVGVLLIVFLLIVIF